MLFILHILPQIDYPKASKNDNLYAAGYVPLDGIQTLLATSFTRKKKATHVLREH
jgi:hypothetical protein